MISVREKGKNRRNQEVLPVREEGDNQWNRLNREYRELGDEGNVGNNEGLDHFGGERVKERFRQEFRFRA